MSQTIKRLVRPNYLLLILFLAAAQCGVFSVRRSGAEGGIPHIPNAAEVPLTFADWKGKDLGLDKESLEMLRPEAYLVRDYQDATGHRINLMLIYGHEKSNIHSPAFCLLGGGWNIVASGQILTNEKRRSGADKLKLNRLLLQKGDNKAIVLYSFLSPGDSTASWAAFQARFLLTRLSGKRPSGALLRLVVPLEGSERETEETAKRFLKDCYPFICKTFAL